MKADLASSHPSDRTCLPETVPHWTRYSDCQMLGSLCYYLDQCSRNSFCIPVPHYTLEKPSSESLPLDSISIPSLYSRPKLGYSFCLSDFDNSVPREFRIISIDLRSASNSRNPAIASEVGVFRRSRCLVIKD